MSALEQSRGTDEASTLTLVREVEAGPAEVWRCLTDPECFKVWWHRNLEFEAQDGGRFQAPWVDPTGRDRTVKAQVTAFHPPQGLVMVWADEDWSFSTVVSLWIEASGSGSRITLEHQGWQHAPDDLRDELMQHHETGWSDHLKNWATHAEGLKGRRTDD